MIDLSLLLCTLAIAVDGATVGRIIGGTDAPEHKYPYQVSFRERIEGFTDFHFCSGSIINEKWLLTAAHCFQNRPIRNVVAVAGTNYLNEKGESYKIESYMIHEDNVDFMHDDICLVHVVGEIRFSDIVKAIRLPIADSTDDDIPAVFSGWGSTVLGGPSPNKLQEIQLRVMSNERCKNVWDITGRHVCTLTKQGEGICHGDSGGPLVVNGYQVGIASYVSPCALGYPDVYTRVHPFVGWIQRTQMKYN